MRNTGSRRARTIPGAGAAFAALVAAPAQAADGLVLVPEATLLVVLLVAFTLLVFPVNALVFKPLFRVLALREERIAGARRRALELERDAADVLARYRQAIRDVREEAEQSRRVGLEEARTESGSVSTAARSQAESVLQAGREELDAWLDQARNELRGSADSLARTAAERVLGRSLS